MKAVLCVYVKKNCNNMYLFAIIIKNINIASYNLFSLSL